MASKKKDDENYKARAIRIKNGTPLASMLDVWTHAATRLYNSATFFNRNTLTGLALPENDRHPNQQHAIDEIESILPMHKRTRWKSTSRKLNKISREVRDALLAADEKKANDGKAEGKTKRKNAHEAIAKENILNQRHRRANYNELDAYYKYTNDENYRAIPVHAAQNILREVDDAWNNWAEQLHDWKRGNSMGLSGRPGMPSYKDKKTRKSIEIPAADIVIVEEEPSGKTGKKNAKKRVFAQLPLIREQERIEITDIAPDGMKLVTVQINPVSGGYDVTFVFKAKKPTLSDDPYFAGGDLGLDNLLAIVVNNGVTHPLIIDGKELKSVNRYWNKKIASMKSELPNGTYSSKAIDAAWAKRRAQLHDGMNQAANIVIDFLLEHHVGKLVIGKNDGWKEGFAGKVPTHRKNKQDFVFMPYDYLIKRLSHKCAEVGIAFIVREESYTSKASLVDGDWIPTYGVDEVPEDGFKFNGSRKSRGCYCSEKTKIGDNGIILNADVNGAGNILRKEYNGAFEGVSDWRYLMCPERVKLSVVKWSTRNVSRDAFS